MILFKNMSWVLCVCGMEWYKKKVHSTFSWKSNERNGLFNGLTSDSRLSRRKSSSDSKRPFWSGMTRGTLYIKLGLVCSYRPIPPIESYGNMLDSRCWAAVWFIPLYISCLLHQQEVAQVTRVIQSQSLGHNSTFPAWKINRHQRSKQFRVSFFLFFDFDLK